MRGFVVNEKGRRVDAFVQSTDKNLMVPVGGSIIAGKVYRKPRVGKKSKF